LIDTIKRKCVLVVDEIGNIFLLADEEETDTRRNFKQCKCPECRQSTFFKPVLGGFVCNKCGKYVTSEQIKTEE
jgi:DNA-directed RNA polymerase subunit RPC12/RpoP